MGSIAIYPDPEDFWADLGLVGGEVPKFRAAKSSRPSSRVTGVL